MGRVQVRVLIGLMLAIVMLPNLVLADSAAEAVSAALDEQDAWLANTEKGPKWQTFLVAEALREQLARGQDADKRVVAEAIGRYESGAPGLEYRPLQLTRQRLGAWADALGVPMALRWAARARAAALYDPPRPGEQLEEAESELQQAMEKLDEWFAEGAERKANGWRRFIQWEALQQQLEGDTPDWTALEGIAAQFYDGHPGLELPPFVRVRDALRRYTFLGALSKQPMETRRTTTVARLNALADALEKYNEAPSARSAGNVAALLDWLDQMGHLPGLAGDVRAFHQRPNIFVNVSEDFISRRFADTVNEVRPVNEMILQTHVRGTAYTVGDITADILPSQRGARIDIVLQGTTTTRSVGRQSPVTIHSRSRTSVYARKPLTVFPGSLASGPARASCRTRTTIFSIVPDQRLGRKLVERIAWKRATAQKPQAERIASGRAETRVERQMDQRAEELLADAKAKLRDDLRGPLDRRGLIPDSVAVRSSDRDVLVTATQADRGQLAAATAPPAFAAGRAVAALVHESVVNNTAEQAIAGLRLTDERIAELVEEFTGSVPEPLQLSDDKAPWSISFDWQQPVTVQFDDQTMTLAVRGRRFTSGERTLNERMEMSATYSMQTAPVGIVLIRQGDIQVSFLDQREGQRPSNRQIFFRTLMRTKFDSLFQAEIQGEGIELPGRWETAGRLILDELSTSDGWLSLGWQLRSAAEAKAK